MCYPGKFRCFVLKAENLPPFVHQVFHMLPDLGTKILRIFHVTVLHVTQNKHLKEAAVRNKKWL